MQWIKLLWKYNQVKLPNKISQWASENDAYSNPYDLLDPATLLLNNFILISRSYDSFGL